MWSYLTLKSKKENFHKFQLSCLANVVVLPNFLQMMRLIQMAFKFMDIDSNEYQKKHMFGTYVGIEVFIQLLLISFSVMVYKRCQNNIITITSLFLFLMQLTRILFQQ